MLDIIFFSVLYILTIACSGTLYIYFKHMEVYFKDLKVHFKDLKVIFKITLL